MVYLYPEDEFHNHQVLKTRPNPRAEEFECGFITNRDNVKLFYRGWRYQNTMANSQSQVHIMLHVHGMVTHSEQYITLADGLVSEDLIMYGFDLMGHGHSEGIRGDYSNFNLFLENIEDMLLFLKTKYPNGIYFLCGESMGGLASILYLTSKFLSNPIVPIKKVLLWAPALAPPELGNITLKDLSTGIELLCKLLFCSTRVSINSVHEKTFRDPACLQYDIEDPFNLPQYSARYLWNINHAMNLLQKLNKTVQIQTPFCIIRGTEDKVVSKKQIEKFFKRNQTRLECEYYEVPESLHCVFKDPAFTQHYWDLIRKFLFQTK